jgi:hypothetical protein
VTVGDRHGKSFRFCVEVKSHDALPTEICTVKQYQIDKEKNKGKTKTMKVVNSMHGFLVENGKAPCLLTSCTTGPQCSADIVNSLLSHFLWDPLAGLTYGAFFNGEAFIFIKIDRSAPSVVGRSFPMYMSEPIHVGLVLL